MASNAPSLLCATLSTQEDQAVEHSALISLGLTLGVVNERITIRPAVANITVEDDDSMLILFMKLTLQHAEP